MTAAVYDSNFSVQLHAHRPVASANLAGDEIVCAVCGKTLVILCPDGHEDALDTIRYSNGLKPAKPTRACACGNPLNGKAKECADCRAEARVRRCSCGNELRKHAQFCDDCKAKRAEATTRRSCGCGKTLEKGERRCAECKAKPRTPPRDGARAMSGGAARLSWRTRDAGDRRRGVSGIGCLSRREGANAAS